MKLRINVDEAPPLKPTRSLVPVPRDFVIANLCPVYDSAPSCQLKNADSFPWWSGRVSRAP